MKNTAAYFKEYYKTHAEKIRDYQKEYRLRHAQEKKAHAKAYYRANREKLKAYAKSYRLANTEKIRIYRLKNVDKTNAKRRANPEKNRLYRRKRRALQHTNIHEPYTDTYIFNRDGWICGICGRKINKRLKHPHLLSGSIDHIIPLSKGGSDTPLNLQAAHLGCNQIKHAKFGGQLRLPFNMRQVLQAVESGKMTAESEKL